MANERDENIWKKLNEIRRVRNCDAYLHYAFPTINFSFNYYHNNILDSSTKLLTGDQLMKVYASKLF